jgi:hypothetical protein
LADTATDLTVDSHGQARVPLSFAELLRNRRDLVVRHPDLNRNHPRLKPWHSGVEVKASVNRNGDIMPGSCNEPANITDNISVSGLVALFCNPHLFWVFLRGWKYPLRFHGGFWRPHRLTGYFLETKLVR